MYYVEKKAKKAMVPMKNIVRAMLTMEPKAENFNLALVILSMDSGYLLIFSDFKKQRYKKYHWGCERFIKPYLFKTSNTELLLLNSGTISFIFATILNGSSLQ